VVGAGAGRTLAVFVESVSAGAFASFGAWVQAATNPQAMIAAIAATDRRGCSQRLASEYIAFPPRISVFDPLTPRNPTSLPPVGQHDVHAVKLCQQDCRGFQRRNPDLRRAPFLTMVGR